MDYEAKNGARQRRKQRMKAATMKDEVKAFKTERLLKHSFHPSAFILAFSSLLFHPRFSLEETDEVSGVVDDGERARAVLLHDLVCAGHADGRLDEKLWADGAHHVACAQDAPTLARLRLQVFQRQDAVEAALMCDGETGLRVLREDGIAEVAHQDVRLDRYGKRRRFADGRRLGGARLPHDLGGGVQQKETDQHRP